MMSIFKKPAVPSVQDIQQRAGPEPAPPPTSADSTVQNAGANASAGYTSLVSSGSAGGLKRKASTQKSTLIGGA